MSVLSLTSAAAEKLPKQALELLSLTPDHFASTAQLKDDDLETTAQISTVNGFQEKNGLLRVVNQDVFIRAFINKRTGATTYQVYALVLYDGDWRFYRTANYETATDPVSVELTQIASDVLGCSRYSGCLHREDFGFYVPEDLLRTIAASYSPGQMLAWKFKFKPKSGEDWLYGITPAEVAGLLQAVDAYRSSHVVARFMAPPPSQFPAPPVAAADPSPPETPTSVTSASTPTPTKPAQAKAECGMVRQRDQSLKMVPC